jgi:Flp pilus assembly protein TadD
VEASIDVFQQALKLSPRATHILSNLGFAQLRAGNPELAAQTLVTALKIDPANADARKHWATAMSFVGAERARYWVAKLDAKDDTPAQLATALPAADAKATSPSTSAAAVPPVAPAVKTTALQTAVPTTPVIAATVPSEVSAPSVMNLKYPDAVVAATAPTPNSVSDARPIIGVSQQNTQVVNVSDSNATAPQAGADVDASPSVLNLAYAESQLKTAEPDAAALTREAQIALMEGKEKLAVSLFKAALKADPRNGVARLGLATVLADREKAESLAPQPLVMQALSQIPAPTPAKPIAINVDRSSRTRAIEGDEPKVLISNGVGKKGLACREAKALSSRGWKAQGCADYKNFAQKQSIIFYVKGKEEAAKRLRSALLQPGTVELRRVNSLSHNAQLQVLIGQDWGKVRPVIRPRT